MATDTVFGNRSAESFATDYQSLVFVIGQLIAKIITIVPVRVEAVTNGGSLSSCAYVNVQPLLNQQTGNQTALEHGIIYNVPVFRLQGGASAAVIDPVAGDVGAMLVAYRDISAIVAADSSSPGSLQGGSKLYNPGSQAQYDWSSGLYLGGWLNGTVSNYIQLNSSGINIHAPNGITLNGVTIDSSGNIVTSGNVNGATVTGSTDVLYGTLAGGGVSLKNHVHTSASSGSPTSAPTPGT